MAVKRLWLGTMTGSANVLHKVETGSRISVRIAKLIGRALLHWHVRAITLHLLLFILMRELMTGYCVIGLLLISAGVALICKGVTVSISIAGFSCRSPSVIRFGIGSIAPVRRNQVLIVVFSVNGLRRCSRAVFEVGSSVVQFSRLLLSGWRLGLQAVAVPNADYRNVSLLCLLYKTKESPSPRAVQDSQGDSREHLDDSRESAEYIE